MNIAIIPARGGSKRIPRKNIKLFLGKPMLAYSIEAARKSGLVGKVMVSTDDEEIARVAKEFGAEVPFMRSAKNADDHATLRDVIDEVVRSYKAQGMAFDYGCCILSTAPLIRQERFAAGFELLKKGGFDGVQPIVRFPYPIQRALRKKEDGEVEFMNPEHKRTRSQDLEPAYYDAGQFYWFRWEKGFDGARSGGFEIPESEVQDIDTEEDWKLAEIKYRLMHERA